MYDVIECFRSVAPTKDTKLIVFQTPDEAVARMQADRLLEASSAGCHDIGGPHVPRLGTSTFVVIDRSTSRELYRIPDA